MGQNSKLKPIDFTNAGGKTVYLGSQPFNLEPAISCIRDRILKVRESLNRRPLVVLMGEDHRISSHVLLQLLSLLDAHKKFGSQVGCGIELPYNIAGNMLLHRGHSECEVKGMLATDDDGQLSLTEIMNEGVTLDAKYSHGTVWGNCLARKISTCFTDAAMNPDNPMYLDCHDEYNLLFMGQHSFNGIRHIHSQTEIGMNLRNRFIAQKIKSHIQYSGIKILFMGVGAAHIFGMHHQSSFQESLACQFERAGMPFMVVLPFGKEIRIFDIPAAAAKFFSQTIGVMGMDETKFPEGQSNGELEYIQNVMAQSGRLARAVSAP